MGLIGAAMGAAGSIFGGIKASKAMKKVKQNINQQLDDNQNWYDRRYNEDATQRADAQSVLTRLEDNIKNRNRQAAGAQAVMGSTDEATAAAKAANNKALSDATSNIAAAADKQKDGIEQQFQARDANLQGQLNQAEVGKAQAIGRAVQGVTDAAGSLDFGTGKLFGKTFDL